MKNYSFLLSLIFTIIFTFPSISEIKRGEWEFIKDTNYRCFIQSAPIKTDIPKGKSRGKHYIVVYRMNKNPEAIIQITAGYNYKSADSIKVKIDNIDYDFYSDADNAWTKEDKKVIFAMKKGLELVTTGISSNNTKVIDTYTLKGFTAAFNQLINDC
jgi:invasion protein IalB